MVRVFATLHVLFCLENHTFTIHQPQFERPSL